MHYKILRFCLDVDLLFDFCFVSSNYFTQYSSRRIQAYRLYTQMIQYAFIYLLVF